MNCREQAVKIYETCVAYAKTGRTLTYRELLDSLGYKEAASGNVVRYGLELAWIACMHSNLPPVTSIVVNQASGKPSAGYPLEDWDRDKKAVFDEGVIWPSAVGIDWEYVWEERKELSRKYGTRGYWAK